VKKFLVIPLIVMMPPLHSAERIAEQAAQSLARAKPRGLYTAEGIRIGSKEYFEHAQQLLAAQKAAEKAEQLAAEEQYATKMASPLEGLSDEVKINILLQKVAIAQDSIETGALIRAFRQTNKEWRTIIDGEKETNALAKAMMKRFGIPRSGALIALGTPTAIQTFMKELYTEPEFKNEFIRMVSSIKAMKAAAQPLTRFDQRILALEPDYLIQWSNYNPQLYPLPGVARINPIDYIVLTYKEEGYGNPEMPTPTEFQDLRQHANLLRSLNIRRMPTYAEQSQDVRQLAPLLRFLMAAGVRPSEQALKELVGLLRVSKIELLYNEKALSPAQIQEFIIKTQLLSQLNRH